MAKKEKVTTGEFNFDDLDSFDFGFDNNEINSKDLNKKDRKPVSRVFKGAITGASKSTLNTDFLKNVTKKSLPKEYSYAIDATEGVSTDLSRMYAEASKEIKPKLQSIYREIDKLIPNESKVLKKTSEKIKKFLGNDEDSYYRNRESDEDYKSSRFVNEAFNIQGGISEKRKAADRADSDIKFKIQSKKSDILANILHNINTGISRLNAYNDNINLPYAKKSLEIQYRSYHVQTELLKETRRYNEIFKAQNEGIIRNTELPDFVKAKKSELMHEFTLNKFMQNAHEGLFNSDISKKIKGKIKSAISDKISDVGMTLDSLSMALDSANTIREMQNSAGGDKYKNYGEMGGNALGGGVLPWMFGKILGSKFKIPTGKIAKAGFKLNKNLQNIPGFIERLKGSDFVKNAEDRLLNINAGLDQEYDVNGKPIKKGWLTRQKEKLKAKAGLATGGLLDMVTPSSPDMRIENRENNLGLNQPAIFDNQVKKSITAIIPGYLARILRELEITRGGGKEVDLTTFDFKSNKFISRKQLTKKISTDLAKEAIDQRGYGRHLENTMGILDKNKELSPEARKILETLIRKKAFSGHNLDIDVLTNEKEYKGYKKGVYQEIRTHLDKTYGKGVEGNEQKDMELSIALSNLKKSTGDVRSNIQTLYDSGYSEELEKLRIVKKNRYGALEINERAYLDLLSKSKPNQNQIYDLYKEIDKFSDEEIQNRREVVDKLVNKGFKSLLDELDVITVNRLGIYKVVNAKYDKLVKDSKKKKSSGINTVKATRRGKGGTPSSPPSSPPTTPTGSGGGSSGPTGGYRFTSTGNITSKLNPTNDSDFDGNLALDTSDTGITSKRRHIRKLKETIGRSNYLNRFKNKVTDIYVDSKIEPVLKGIDIKNGVYYDGITGKQITSIEDIKGTVKDLAGRVILSFNDLQNGLHDSEGWPVRVKLHRELADLKTELNAKYIDKVNSFMNKFGVSKTEDKHSCPVDIYTEGKVNPLLTAIGIESGDYYDGLTGDQIKSMSDVKGPVENRDGKILLTFMDIHKGLIDREGNKIKLNCHREVSDLLKTFRNKITKKGSDFIKDKIKNSETAQNILNQASGFIDKGLGVTESFVPIQESGKAPNVTDSLFGIAGGIGSGILGKGKSILDKFRNRKVETNKERVKKEIAEGGEINKRHKRTAKSYKKSEADKSGITPETDKKPSESTDSSLLSSLKSAGKKLFDTTTSGITGLKSHLVEHPEAETDAKGRWYNLVEAMKEKARIKKEENLAKAKANLASLDPRYKSTKNVLDGMIDKVKDSMDLIKKGMSSFADLFGKGQEGFEILKRGKKGILGKGIEEAEEVAGNVAGGAKKGLLGKVGSGLWNTAKGIGGLAGAAGGAILGAAGRDLKGAPGRFRKLGKGIKAVGSGIGAGVSAAGKIGSKIGEGAGIVSKVGKPLVEIIGKAGSMTGATTLLRGASGLVGADSILGTAAMVSDMFLTGGLASLSLTAIQAGMGIIGAALGSPLVLGSLAIAGIGYGAYKAYKYFTRNKVTSLTKIRLRQYGFTDENKDQYHRVLELESYLLENNIAYNNNRAMFKNNPNTVELLDMFNIDPKDDKHVACFMKWFVGRFKPVFINSLNSLKQIDNKIKLSDVDDLDSDKKLQFINASTFEHGPYTQTTSPLIEFEELKACRMTIKYPRNGVFS